MLPVRMVKILLQQYRHIAAQSQCGGMSAAGESGPRIVIATCAGGQRMHARRNNPNVWPVALALLLVRRGRRTWRCPHSADMRALSEGAGFDPSLHFGGQFCCDAQRCPLVGFLHMSYAPAFGGRPWRMKTVSPWPISAFWPNRHAWQSSHGFLFSL
jgi:hypothetical protein